MNSIRGRLLVTLLTGLSVVLAGGGAAVYSIERQSLLRQFDADLRSRALTLASLVKFEPQGLIFESSDAPASTIAETYFEIRTGAGNVLKRSANLGEATLASREASAIHMTFDDVQLPGSVSGRAAWHAFTPRVDPDDWPGRHVKDIEPDLVVFLIALDRSSMDRALAALMTALLIVGGLAALTAAFVVTLGVRWGLRPLDRLGRQLQTINGSTISKRLEDASAPRELEPMYRDLNAMLDRVEQNVRRERLFVNAAAHEFRTPLTELRAAAEVAMKWPDARRTQEVLEEIVAIGRDMERLIASLLLISRAHTLPATAENHQFSWAAMVQSCIHLAHPMIERKRLRLDVNMEVSPGVHDDHVIGTAAEMIVRNLIDNAVHYTPDEGCISIQVGQPGNGSTALLVENSPVALTQDDLPELFEPFWRLDGARGDRRHAGLGLTVVREVAGALGLRVEAALSGDRLQMRVSRIN